ncbi:hypothetical protein IAR55_003659 [Kwoniella newhampshirensis]|uniref:Uncharacterized protein n=1 Tax=Kwoniella newhampshirensis TaxID=1651941 RepID=A0AAW0YZN4_9TREE
MIMTSSPLLTPHSRSITHTPSPGSSPKLRPVASTMAKQQSSLPIGAGALPVSATSASSSGMSTSLPSRSFVRGPQARPYLSPLCSRGLSAKGGKELDGDTRRFAEIVKRVVDDRAEDKRKGDLIEMIENVHLEEGHLPAPPRRGRSVAGSVAGSWETERAELIVDIPVWSPGCFQDLSTLHALRDTTLSHTHSLLGYLLNAHSVPATYRLLARSAVTPPGGKVSPFHHGWGCIRLAPSVASPSSHHCELTHQVRRASFVHTHSTPNASLKASHTAAARQSEHHHENCHEQVIVDSDDEDEVDVTLKEGFRSDSFSGGSDDEDDEEPADVIVAREIERRGGKEGTVFMMTLFGQPALILT